MKVELGGVVVELLPSGSCQPTGVQWSVLSSATNVNVKQARAKNCFRSTKYLKSTVDPRPNASTYISELYTLLDS